MNRHVLCLAALLSISLAAQASAEALLRPNVLVDGDVIKLSDLFDNAGPQGATAVARAPSAGRRVTVDADWLAGIASLYGVSWHPQTGFEQAVIERTGVQVESGQIVDALRQALIKQGVGAGAEIEMANRNPQLFVPVGATSEIAVKDLAYDSQYKRFTATLEAPANQPSASRIRVSGAVYNTVEIPIPVHTLLKGEVIKASDMSWERVRDTQTRRDIIIDVDQAIGMVPKRALRLGQPIAINDIERPVAVAKGALVTMTLIAGAMSLSTQGLALEQGSLGDVIRLSNTRSNQTVEGKVDGPNLVTVTLNGAVALAN